MDRKQKTIAQIATAARVAKATRMPREAVLALMLVDSWLDLQERLVVAVERIEKKTTVI